VVFKYNFQTKQYECDKEEEHQRLKDRMKQNPKVLKETFDRLNNEKNLQPFNIKMPCTKKAFLTFLAFFLKVMYLVISFIFLQLALFNVILLGLIIMFFFKVNYYFDEFIIKKEYKYQNKDFDKFIETQNELPAYKQACVNITSMEQGKYLEFHLPEDYEQQNNESLLTPSG
jgi:hypothetical protein